MEGNCEKDSEAAKASDYSLADLPICLLKCLVSSFQGKFPTKEDREHFRDQAKEWLNRLTVVFIAPLLRSIVQLRRPSWVMVALTAVIAAVGYYQWKSIEQQVDLGRNQIGQTTTSLEYMEEQIKQMKLENRPWISIDSAENLQLNSAERMKCAIYFDNTGKTPGVIDVIKVRFVVVPKGAEIGPEVAKNQLHAILSQRGEVQYNVAPSAKKRLPIVGEVLWPQQFDSISQDGADLYLIVRILYRDQFDDSFITQAVFVRRDGDRAGEHDLRTHNKYNEMD